MLWFRTGISRAKHLCLAIKHDTNVTCSFTWTLAHVSFNGVCRQSAVVGKTTYPQNFAGGRVGQFQISCTTHPPSVREPILQSFRPVPTYFDPAAWGAWESRNWHNLLSWRENWMRLSCKASTGSVHRDILPSGTQFWRERRLMSAKQASHPYGCLQQVCRLAERYAHALIRL